MTGLSAVQASAVYDVLVEHAGANDDEDARDQFVYHLTDGCREYRFMGWLGSGGKLYVEAKRWRVSCYREDQTPERLAAIEATNAALDHLYAANHHEETR